MTWWNMLLVAVLASAIVALSLAVKWGREASRNWKQAEKSWREANAGWQSAAENWERAAENWKRAAEAWKARNARLGAWPEAPTTPKEERKP